MGCLSDAGADQTTEYRLIAAPYEDEMIRFPLSGTAPAAPHLLFGSVVPQRRPGGSISGQSV
jgi:hypothetical protein